MILQPRAKLIQPDGDHAEIELRRRIVAAVRTEHRQNFAQGVDDRQRVIPSIVGVLFILLQAVQRDQFGQDHRQQAEVIGDAQRCRWLGQRQQLEQFVADALNRGVEQVGRVGADRLLAFPRSMRKPN